MRRGFLSLLPCCALAALSTGAAVAQGESYMALVGELVGAVESPRVVMETCVARKSGRRGELQPAFEAWRARHGTLLGQVDAQLARADARLRADNPDSGARSVADAMNRILQRRYESLDAAALRQLCGRYPEMLRAKDLEMQAEVPALLKRVVEAERPPVAIAPR